MLGPYPAERMTMWPVDKRVGNVKNNDPVADELGSSNSKDDWFEAARLLKPLNC